MTPLDPTHPLPDNTGGSEPQSLNSRAARIRAAADGEIPPSSVSREDLTRIEFERDLRRAVDRVVTDHPAPAALRDSIRQMFREYATPGAAPAPLPVRLAPETRTPAFWRRSARWAAAAAVLALCAGGVFFASRTGAVSTAPFGGPNGALRVASFVERENDACAELNEHFREKFRAAAPEEARALADEIFQSVPPALVAADDTLASVGFQFAGFGRCGVPGGGPSAHLVYHKQDADSGRTEALSLFIRESERGAKPLETSCGYLLDCPKANDDRVLAWRDGRFIYYLFSRNAQAMDAARAAFKAPNREIEIR